GGTHDAPFHPAPGTSVTVAMMQVRARLRYLRGDGYQAVELPYAGGRLGMVIVLPDGPAGPMASRLTAGGLPGLLAGLATAQVTLALPRFRVPSQVPPRRGAPPPGPGHQPVRAAPGADRAGHAAGVHRRGRLQRDHHRRAAGHQ